MLALVVCQVPGRLFFLSRLWQGLPSANLSTSPEKDFALQAIQPVVAPVLKLVHDEGPGASSLLPVRVALRPLFVSQLLMETRQRPRFTHFCPDFPAGLSPPL